MRKYVNEKNCLAILYPHLIQEWHPTKNKLLPNEVASGSSTKYWWICDKGHEWEESCANRSRKNYKCPYCSNSRVCKDNCLSATHPEVAKQWHPTKNGEITPNDIVGGTLKKHWWICEKGHEWKAEGNNRINGGRQKEGTGCPYCANKKLCNDNCLQTCYPEIAKEWHPTKNCDLRPKDVIVGSHKKIWWLCEKGHEWKTSCNKRINGGRQKEGTCCPFCRESLGEKKIAKILKEKGLSFNRQVRFDDCRSTNPLPFDFMVNNILIEYHGEQHYHPVSFGKINKEKANEEFINRKKLDIIKENWCKNKNVKLCIIPYWEYKNIDKILNSII